MTPGLTGHRVLMENWIYRTTCLDGKLN